MRQGWLCCLNLMLSLIAFHQVPCTRHGVLLRPLLQTKWLLTCAPVGIGWFCVVVLRRTRVSGGTLEAPLGLKQRQGQGWRYRTLLRRGPLKTCLLNRLFLVLLGQAKFVLLPARGREKSPVVRWSCHGGLKCQVSSPPASPPRRSLVEDPSFASALAAPGSRGKSRRSGRDRRAAPVFQMGFPWTEFLHHLNIFNCLRRLPICIDFRSLCLIELPIELVFDLYCIYIVV